MRALVCLFVCEREVVCVCARAQQCMHTIHVMDVSPNQWLHCNLLGNCGFTQSKASSKKQLPGLPWAAKKQGLRSYCAQLAVLPASTMKEGLAKKKKKIKFHL